MKSNRVTIKQKEYIASEMMRLVAENMQKEKNISFEKALSKFIKSNAYDLLYDFRTELWKEGPVYIETFV